MGGQFKCNERGRNVGGEGGGGRPFLIKFVQLVTLSILYVD